VTTKQASGFAVSTAKQPALGGFAQSLM
jgi:hypothetical protein